MPHNIDRSKPEQQFVFSEVKPAEEIYDKPLTNVFESYIQDGEKWLQTKATTQ